MLLEIVWISTLVETRTALFGPRMIFSVTDLRKKLEQARKNRH